MREGIVTFTRRTWRRPSPFPPPSPGTLKWTTRSKTMILPK